ncbi:helix-turn-helix domain-containing protein [bacterium]|nr:helix-turn-helix domain-containing protein [bacterium]MCB1219268.1 helix-turn-helix domain-containing protein [bacterium]UNM09517.1 MAG: helix-turn-helix domain-containing protein [Planctomycetales bacterium]
MPERTSIRQRAGLYLRFLRLKAGLEQSAVAARLEVSQPTISRLEKGLGSPEPGHIAAWLAICLEQGDVMGLDQASAVLRLLQDILVMDEEGPALAAELDRLLSAMVTERPEMAAGVPYFADVAAGPGESQQPRVEPRSYIEVPAGVVARDPQAFALRIVGDSMQPLLLEGDIVVISPAAQLIEGCIVAAYVEPDGDVVKRYHPCRSADCEARLRSANPAYADIKLGGENGRSGRIWGRVLFCQREL